LKFSQDTGDFKLLIKPIQDYIKRIVTFFSGFDTLVNFNISDNLSKITIPEAKYCFAIQSLIENVHGETYSAQLEAIVSEDERKILINQWRDKKSPVGVLVDLANKWKNSLITLGENIVAFAFIEGVLFSGAFASIEWLRVKGKELNSKKGKQFMQGLTQSNEFIARDEGLHVRTAVEIYKLMTKKLESKKVLEIAKELTEAAKTFMTDTLPEELIGLNKKSFCSHIEHCANRLLEMLGYENKLYKKSKPLEFMVNFGIDAKINFFERLSTGYQNGVFNKDELKDNKDGSLEISEDF
jgi:ribonucleotide reductase beta subunit family protein with ferritin-like domain